MTEEIIRRTERFLREQLAAMAEYEGVGQRAEDYRIEHSLRVANVGREIAAKEGLDEEKLVVACLLHDVGYARKFKDDADFLNHGRYSAEIARPFLASLGYSDADVDEMCFGIAIHVDDKADFEHERTPLALSVGDADNIDRFDAYRLDENLLFADYVNLTLEQQRAYCEKRIAGLTRLRGMEFGTKTATAMWQEKIDYQLGFVRKLLAQIENSTIEKLIEASAAGC